VPESSDRASQVPVVLAINDAYVYPLIISVLSTQLHNANQVNFVIAFDGTLLSNESRKLIEEVFNFEKIHYRFLEIDISSSRWDGIFINSSHFGRMAYMKLLLPEFIPTNFLWVDADTLVRGPLDDLLRDPFFNSENILSAVPEHFPDYRWNINKAIRMAGVNYFNAGVMLVNSQRWLEVGINLRWRKVITKYEKFSFGLADQDILNYIFATQAGFIPLSEKYNFGCGLDLNDPDTRILHFKGGSKPWHFNFSDLAKKGRHFREYLDFELSLLLDLNGDRELHRKVEDLRMSLISEKASTEINQPTFRIRIKHRIKMVLFLARQLVIEIEITSRGK